MQRKRARDEVAEILLVHKKVQRYRFHDGIGVFDFPWLEDGVVFEEKFALTSYLDETFAADCNMQNLTVSHGVDNDDLSLDDLLEYV